MLFSMTGYGDHSASVEDWHVQVIVQTLNCRYLDVRIDAPKWLNAQFFSWRRLLEERLVRGKVAVSVECYAEDTLAPILLKEDLIERYYRRLETLAKKLSVKADLFTLTVNFLAKRKKEVFVLDDDRIACIQASFEKALASCVESRRQEGNNLAKQLISCLAFIEDGLNQVIAYDPSRKARLYKKLEDRIQMREGEKEADNNNWEREVVYYLEKIDIQEEVVRLKSHVDYFRRAMKNDEGISVGKKLGFIIQEMMREVNTIGAKAQDSTLQQLIVEMKQYLEQIKEQIQNIL